ncbi:MAG: hypothetical protein ABIZ80_12015 [Bryobacteraceae bacterium]
MNAQIGGGGFIRLEILGRDGHPVPGYSLAKSHRLMGNSLHHVPAWKGGQTISALSGQPVRLRFVMRDANLFHSPARTAAYQSFCSLPYQ